MQDTARSVDLGGATPILVGNRYRGQATAFGAALAPPHDARDGSVQGADAREPSPD